MYVLLEPGMKIKHGDESLCDDSYSWELSGLGDGVVYSEAHVVMRREINTIDDLLQLKGE